MDRHERIRVAYSKLRDSLNERARRIWAAKAAAWFGRGGIAAVRRVTGLSYETVARGRDELAAGTAPPLGRVRRPGAGRKRSSLLDPTLQGDIETLIDPESRFDPEAPLRWTSKSARQLGRELRSSGHACPDTVVRGLLDELGYRRHAIRRSKEGARRPDFDAQFEHVSGRIKRQLAAGEPAIVVDTKRREPTRVARAAGREWHLERERLPANVRNFISSEGGQVARHGRTDILREWCWGNAGISSDTAAYAAATVGCWWRLVGSAAYAHATTLLVIVDADGGDGPRLRLWKLGLQALADETGLAISVCHLPPGTSRWNRIEHRIVSFTTGITDAGPRLQRAAVVSEVLKSPVGTASPVLFGTDGTVFRNGVSAKADELATVRIERDAFHGDWNYTIRLR